MDNKGNYDEEPPPENTTKQGTDRVPIRKSDVVCPLERTGFSFRVPGFGSFLPHRRR
jgi:hypothetical protein